MDGCSSYRFGAGRYFQAKNLLAESGNEILRYGKKAYVVGGSTAFSLTRKTMEESFQKCGLDSVWEEYSGYPSHVKIDELISVVKENQCDVIVGVGGGRIMDLAKATAIGLHIPVVTIPTSAATCAAFSPLSVIYTSEGRSDDYLNFEDEVNAVLVDEDIMLTQPPRLLAAGILDAMAKYIEIATHMENRTDEFGKISDETDISLHSAFYFAKYVYDILEQCGQKAVNDLKEGKWTKELHDVVFLNIALTGVVSAIMRGRGQTALGHAFNNTARTLFLDEVKPYLHGETVAVGLIAQLVYDKNEQKIPQLYQYMRKMDAPCTLQEVGIEPTEANVEKIEKRIQKHPFVKKDEEHYERLNKALNYIAGGKYDFETDER